MRKLTLVVLIAIILVFGCVQQGNARLGLKTKADCTADSMRMVERIPCYHQAAISAAYYLPSDVAEGLCNDIWNDIGEPNKNNDIGTRAETNRNLCFYDIARIIARHDGGEANATSICKNIRQDEYKTKLVGAPVSQEMCLKEVERIAKIRPDKYYISNDNICSVVFILPLLLVFAFRLRG